MREPTAFDPVRTTRRKPRKVYYLKRRNKIADLYAQGMSIRDIAKETGVSKSTVGRDLRWIKSHEHMLRAQDVAEDIIEGEILGEEIPLAVDKYRSAEETAVLQLLENKKTYRQIADELGVGLNTVVRHVNRYLEEYGEWGGRTLMEWRNEELIKVHNELVALQDDLHIEAIPKEDGPGWDLSPYQAGVLRDKARKRLTELSAYKARLLSLLVQKTEVDVKEQSVVVHVQGVDFNSWNTNTTVIPGD